MPTTDDVAVLKQAAAELTIAPRQKRWTHLSLCVLDAVYSIGANYDRVTAPLCMRHAEQTHLADPSVPYADGNTVIGTDREQRLSTFSTWASSLGEHGLAEALGNRQRTYRRKTAPHKSRAVIDYTAILVQHKIETLNDAAALLNDDGRLSSVEADLAHVPGHGSGARRDYLWMLVGDDQRIKPDSMVRRWIARHLRPVNAATARELIRAVAAESACTPWELDHAIWRAQSGRTIATSSAPG